jgi:hypothetical protein
MFLDHRVRSDLLVTNNPVNDGRQGWHSNFGRLRSAAFPTELLELP